MPDVLTAAYGITEMVDETMSNAARVHAVEQGKAANEHSLIAFGGAAPLHAGRLAEKLGIDRIVVPTDAGVGSAVGFLEAPIAYEVVRSRNMRLTAFNPAIVNGLMQEMRDEALAVIRAAEPDADVVERRVAFMRYVGQGHEITIELPNGDFTDNNWQVVQKAFDTEYERHFRRTCRTRRPKILTWSLSVSAGSVQPITARRPGCERGDAGRPTRRVYGAKAGKMRDVPLFRRTDMAPGAGFDGPGIVIEDQTSTYVPNGFSARIAANGYIVIERNGESD